MGVSENSGFYPQLIHGLIGCSIINHPFWGTTIFGNTQMMMGKPLRGFFFRFYWTGVGFDVTRFSCWAAGCFAPGK